ncbi:hypothetical protein HPB47_027755 [Ixodes persulcatus]|uniref:Uncharacterized protein n=1 Tax=Ixodes persulcatus TaxID=34615 RepID=A0AC60PV30_IXOPE|nr:hypothetical protein HPB47_027755 [Ixodes persulcatus]
MEKESEIAAQQRRRAEKLNSSDPEPGTWNLALATRASTDVVNVRVTSMAVTAEDHPIRLRTFLKRLEVNQALDACIYSEVLAKVMTPQENVGQLIVELFDDGVGADVTSNDGIYSAYFTQFKGKGRYSVVAEVVGDGSAIVVRGRRGSGGLPVVASSPASQVKIRVSTNTSSFLKRFEDGVPISETDVVDGQLSPFSARTKPNVTIKIPEDLVSEAKIENRTDFYFCACVLNKDGFDSGASNIALATFEDPSPGQQKSPAWKNGGLIIVVAIVLLVIIMDLL